MLATVAAQAEARRMESVVAVTMSVQNLGRVSLARGEKVYVGWLLSEKEFQPILRHTSIFGFDDGRHDVRITDFDQEGPSQRGFGYFLTNISTGPAPVVVPLSYLFFTES
jgi:hypothetical protein